MNDTYIVYIKTDTQGNIIAVDSSAFLTDTTGWTSLDEGAGDKYHHAQGNYFDKSLLTGKGIYQYKLVSGVPVEKTPEEIAAEEAALPPPSPTQEEKITAMQEQNAMMFETIDTIMTVILPGIASGPVSP